MYQAILDKLPGAVQPFTLQGNVADSIPALGRVPREKFGISITEINKTSSHAGDACEQFSVQSISKVFALTLALRLIGDDIWNCVKRRLTTKTFNAISPLEESEGTPRNPFTNAGALTIVDHLLSFDRQYISKLLELVQHLCGNKTVEYDFKVANSEKATGHRNFAIAYYLKSYGVVKNNVNDILEAYFIQCSLSMSCLELSRALLFLAKGGCNPFTGEQILTPLQNRRMNALLLMFGTYNAAGDFVFRVGLPGKSGVGGGLSVIIPGRMSIATWSPSLDEFGTSIAGLKALELFIYSTDLTIL
jgi:glutaminase